MLTLLPLKTWIFAAGFGGLIQVFRTKYKNFSLSKEYDKNLKEIRNQYLNMIREDLKKNKEKYISEELNQYDLREFNKVIEKIYEEENFASLIDKRVRFNIDNMKFSSSTSHFNILLIGPSGVGKSTLINSVLHLNKSTEQFAEAGVGKPKTLGEPKPYTSETVRGLRLWDSQGIDKSSYGIKELIKSVTNLINGAAKSGDPDNFIHCIWYCFTGHRFEEIERDSLIELMKIYHDETLPIIIVETKAISEESSEEMKIEIEKICAEQNRKMDIIPVLAEDCIVGRGNKKVKVEKNGVDILMQKSFEKIEGAIQSACFHSIRQQIKSDYEKKIQIFHQKIKNQVKQQMNGPFNENISLSELAEKDLKLMEDITKYLIFEGNEMEKLSENSRNNLLDFLRDFVNFCMEKLNEFMEKTVIKTSVELATKYHNKQEEIHKKSEKINKGFLNSITNQIINNISLFKTVGFDTGKDDIKLKEIEQWRKISEDEISVEFQQKIERYFNKEITKFISGQFISKLTQSMIDSFNETFNGIDEYMVEKAGKKVEEISKKIIDKVK